MNPSETIPSKVKGTQFYKINWHAIAPADELTWKREPTNVHDSNAIALYHQGIQIGHIGRDLAEQLAPLIDENKVDMRVIVQAVTGGESQLDLLTNRMKTKHHGCNIEIKLTYTANYMDQFVESENPYSQELYCRPDGGRDGSGMMF